MPDQVTFFEMDLRSLLIHTEAMGNKNQLGLEKVRNDLREFLSELDSEERTSGCWGLVMDDGHKEQDGHFLAYVLTAEEVTLVAGRGNPYEIKTFCENAFRGTHSTLIAELSNRFSVASKRCTVAPAVLDEWTTRS